MTKFLLKRTDALRCGAAAVAVAGLALRGDAGDSAITLDACIQRALKRSPGVIANTHDVAAARAGIKKAEADLLPSFSATAAMETFMGKPISPFSLATLSPLDTASLPTPTSLTTTVKTVDHNSTKTTIVKGARGATHESIVGNAGTTTTRTLSVRTNITQPRMPQVRGLDYPIYTQTAAQLNYPIFASGSFLGLNHPPTVAYAQAVLDVQVSTGQLTKAALINAVENAYITIEWAAGQLKNDREIVNGLNQLLNIYKEEVKLRVDLPSNEGAIRQEIVSAQMHLADTETLLSSAQLQLSRLIGGRGEVLQITPVKAVTVPPIGDLYARVVGRHPQVQVQESTADEAHQLYRIAKSAQWPTVALQSTWALGDDFDHGEQDLWTGAFLVSVPIFDFGSRSDAARQANETWQAELARTAQAKDDVFNAMTSAYASIHEYELGVVAAERQIADAEAALTVLEAQEAQGIVKPEPIVVARLQLIGLKELREVNRYKMLVWYSALRKAAGGNWKWTQ